MFFIPLNDAESRSKYRFIFILLNGVNQARLETTIVDPQILQEFILSVI